MCHSHSEELKLEDINKLLEESKTLEESNQKKAYMERADRLRHDLILMWNKNLRDFNVNLKAIQDSSWSVADAFTKQTN